MLKYIIILILNVWILKSAQAICNQCIANNGAACLSLNEFYLCFGGTLDLTTKFKCPNPNEICTRHAVICMDPTLTSNIVPACGDTSNCGKCEDLNDGAYTCTSRTTFTMCSGNNLTEIRNSCPENQMCDVTIAAQGLPPCVPACSAPTNFCDLMEAIDVPVTTTTQEKTTTENIDTTQEISTTPREISTTTEEIPTTVPSTTTVPITTTVPSTTTTQNPANVSCSQQTAVGRYSNGNDNTCRSYLYCFLRGGTMQTTVLTCPGQLYFNPATSRCGNLQPEGCV